MGRPKLDKKDRKVKLSITLDKDVSRLLDDVTSNKSKFIENLLLKYINNEK